MTDTTTPSLGWRIWHLDTEINLSSPLIGKVSDPSKKPLVWESKTNSGVVVTAGCRICSEVPGDNHACGIFFVADTDRSVIPRQHNRHRIGHRIDPKTIVRYGQVRTVGGVPAVVTLVKPLGRVVPGFKPFGGVPEWRSESAEIVGIILDKTLWAAHDIMRLTYKMPIMLGLSEEVMLAMEKEHRGEGDAATRALLKRHNPWRAGIPARIYNTTKCLTPGCGAPLLLPTDRMCIRHRSGMSR